MLDHQTRAYAYDGIGNRELVTQGVGANSRETAHAADTLNQYDGITHPRVVEVGGQAAPGAAVRLRVDGGPWQVVDRSLLANQTGEPDSFRYEITAPGTDARWLKVEVEAVAGNGTTQAKTAWHYIPPATELPVHDEDGNLKEDARWAYTWDAENRMVAAEEKPRPIVPGGIGSVPARKRLTFAYDHQHRRIAKTVHEWSDTTNSLSRLVKDLRFVYDGWNMIAELDHTFATGTGLAGSRVVRRYVWGLDLAGQQSMGQHPDTFQGAGGVGGLLAMEFQGKVYYPCYGANGNILGWWESTSATSTAGKLVARYDYDPFGNRITNTGPDVELCPFGFSTKYTDSETGLSDYGFRFYNPETGRWLNTDPLEELGFMVLTGGAYSDSYGSPNLYLFSKNNPIVYIDLLGLFVIYVHEEGVGHMGATVTGTSWDVGRYLGKYSDQWAPWGAGPNLIVKTSGKSGSSSKKAYEEFFIDVNWVFAVSCGSPRGGDQPE